MSDDQSDAPKKSKRSVTPSPETLPSASNQPGVSAKGKYGKGYCRDTHDTSKDLTSRHLLGALAGTLPSECLDMEQFITGVMSVKNQVQTSRCVAYALARCAQLRCAITSVPLKEFPSVNCLYTLARAKSRTVEGQSPTKVLTDNGSVPSFAVDGANEFGVAAESAWPSDDLAKLNDEPNLGELRYASQMKFPGYYRITTTGAQRMQDVMQAIAKGYPILIGVQVDPAFEAYSGGIAEPNVTPQIPNAVNAPDLTNDLGGHGLCLFGYKTFANGLVLLRGCNSWGEEWGDYGLFWASQAWLCDDSVMDILVITCDPSHHAVAA